MAYQDVPDNPKFSTEIHKIETEDLVHADLMNDFISKLLTNEVFLKDLTTGISDVLQNHIDARTIHVTEMDKSAWNETYEQATGYTDQKIAQLIDGAPTTLDTLGEIANAMAENKSVVEALDAAIGKKANQTELDTHTKNNNIHILESERTKWNNALQSDGDSKDNTVTFTSADSANPKEWTDVSVLSSGEKHSSIFNKISTMFKNVRYFYKMLGSTDISSIGNGTVTGALNELNTNLGWEYVDWNNPLGSSKNIKIDSQECIISKNLALLHFKATGYNLSNSSNYQLGFCTINVPTSVKMTGMLIGQGFTVKTENSSQYFSYYNVTVVQSNLLGIQFYFDKTAIDSSVYCSILLRR